MDYLALINSVLRKLREDTVTTVNATTYSSLIGDFINLIKEEVEDSWDWNALRDTIQVTTTTDTFRYTLTGSGTRSKILDVFNDTEDVFVHSKSSRFMTAVLSTDPVAVTYPLYYGINGIDTNGDLNVDFYPIPDTTYSINFNMVIPEAELSAATDTSSMSDRVLILGAWAMAVSERGEDGGTGTSKVEVMYKMAWGDAISLDAAHHADELILEVP